MAVLASIVLVGWMSGAHELTVLFTDTPMRPLAAACLVLAAAGLVASARRGWQRVSDALAAAVALVGAFVLIGHATNLRTLFDGWLFGEAQWYDGAEATARMPPLTAACLLALGVAILLLRRHSCAAHVLAALTLNLGYLAMLGHLLGASPLYRVGGATTMPVATAFGLALTAIAVLASLPQRGLLRYLADTGAAGILVRRVIVVVPLALPALTWVLLRMHGARLLDDGTAFAVTAACAMFVITTVVWRAAAMISRLERARAAAHQQVLRANQELERRVTERTAEVVARTAMFTSAFESAPLGMALLSSDGLLLRANDALRRMLGDIDHQGERIDLSAIVHSEDRSGVLEKAAALLQGTLTHGSQECRLVDSNGQRLWAHLTATLLRGRQGDDPVQFLVHVTDVSERKRYERQLEHLADHDPLTALLNRRGFSRRIEGHVAENSRYGDGGALLVLDLDNFKMVNDSLGHAGGDELIVSIAGMLRSKLRNTDIIARLGGDEFAVLVPRARYAEATRLAENLVQAVRTHVGELRERCSIPVTVSIGVALFDDPSLTADEVITNADLAMYEAKQSGRDRWACHRSDDFGRRAAARVTWAHQIEEALEEDRFVLLAQPILDLRSETTAGHELLLRLPTASGDLIPPAGLLPVARHLGLMRRIDEWVVRNGITVAAQGYPSGLLAINLSGASTGDSALATLIDEMVRDADIDPGRVVFEVSESDAIGHIHRTRAFAEQLREIGCRFAIDDFGASMGSFYYMKHLPFDYLKIDGEFVAQCLTNLTDQSAVEAAVGIAKSLGKHTIAESVGDAATLEYLRQVGVDYAQGFHIGRPILSGSGRHRSDAGSGGPGTSFS